MNDKKQSEIGYALTIFELDPNTAYTLDSAQRLTRVPRRLIAQYCKHGLVSTIADPFEHGFLFDDKGIRELRRVHYLQAVCGINLMGVKLIMALLDETERLHGRPHSQFQSFPFSNLIRD